MSGITPGLVLTELCGEVATLTLNRPGSLNAITIGLGEALEQALLTVPDTARVIVIRGAAGNFSVGGDFVELQQLQSEGGSGLAELFERFARACAQISVEDRPVIAAVEGYAFAGGFELVQSCDIALLSETAVLADNHLNFGQVPGGGGSQRLARLVGRQRASAHILGGERLDAATAHSWGLAARVFPASEFDTGVADYAARLAEKDPAALRTTKRLIRRSAEVSLDEGLAEERRAVLAHLAGSSSASGIDSFHERNSAS